MVKFGKFVDILENFAVKFSVFMVAVILLGSLLFSISLIVLGFVVQF